MKKRFVKCKKILALGLAMLTTLQLVACGSSAEGNGVVQKEFVYVPEYVELNDTSWFGAACGTSKGIYYSTTDWNEETGESKTGIFFLDGSTKEVKEIPVNLTEGMEEGASADIMQMSVLSDGTIAVAISSWKITNPETYDGEQAYILKILSAEDGKVLAEVDISKDITEMEEYAYIQSM